MAKKPEPTKPIIWNVYKIAKKAVWLGTVEAPDKLSAIKKAAAEFKCLAAIRDGAAMTPIRNADAAAVGLAREA